PASTANWRRAIWGLTPMPGRTSCWPIGGYSAKIARGACNALRSATRLPRASECQKKVNVMKMTCNRSLPPVKISRSPRQALLLLAAFGLAWACSASVRGAEELTPPTTLGVEGGRFTIDGRPTFPLGISYYGALGTDEDAWRRDLDQMRQCGVNWLRVWATWASFGNDGAAVEPLTGEPRQPFLQSLVRLVAECDRRGLIVDVSLPRGEGATGPPRLMAHEAHLRAVQTIVEALKEHRNWYLDLSNERNIQDQRHTSFDDLCEL